jgi:multidrug efflux pump subunit AcrA (membrane-fusion protein)
MNGIMPTSKNSVIRLLLVGTIVICGCRSAPSADEDSATPAGAITMAVSGARVATKPMRSEIHLLGETEARRHISLRAPMAGRVIGLNILTGDRVKRGEVVAHIISREDEAALNGLATARQVDPSEASSLTDSVKRYVRGAGVPVTVPEDGIVAQRIVSSGQLVADLDQMADLIDPRSVFVNAAVPVDELSTIRSGMEAIIDCPLHPGVDFSARVSGVSPSFNQSGATVAARLEFTGVQRIYEAGAPIEAKVFVRFVPNATTIPLTALFEDAAINNYYVFVAGRDGRAHRQTVTIGIRTGTEVQVTSGVKPGQVVITSGGYALSDGLRVTVTFTPNEG